MNTKNFEFLRDNLKYTGFGEGLAGKLEENLAEGKAQFQLRTTLEFGKQKVDYALDFKKSDKTDMYFFNRYNAVLKPENGEERSQTFYINKNHGVTAKEAFNLLEGRSVNKDLLTKENKPYNAWLQLDFKDTDDNGNHKLKQFSQGYGYDLEKSLAKYPIKELNDPEQKERMIQSLERGNVHKVNFDKDGKEEKMFVQANPQFKNVIVYDADMKKQYQENVSKPDITQGRSESKDKKESVKEAPKSASDEEGPARKKGKKKGVSV